MQAEMLDVLDRPSLAAGLGDDDMPEQLEARGPDRLRLYDVDVADERAFWLIGKCRCTACVGLFLLYGDEADLDQLAHAFGQGNAPLVGICSELVEGLDLKSRRRPWHLIAVGAASSMSAVKPMANHSVNVFVLLASQPLVQPR